VRKCSTACIHRAQDSASIRAALECALHSPGNDPSGDGCDTWIFELVAQTFDPIWFGFSIIIDVCDYVACRDLPAAISCHRYSTIGHELISCVSVVRNPYGRFASRPILRDDDLERRHTLCLQRINTFLQFPWPIARADHNGNRRSAHHPFISPPTERWAACGPAS